jgi:hypothetical protein
MALELEHQLALEETDSLPPMSPVHAKGNRPPSLDPHVLSSIVVQLRESLAAMTKERDDLLALTAGYLDREATLKDAMQHLTDKHTVVLEELKEAQHKAQEDAENISMLRAKVEESRRGLMRLQTENRRASVMSLDTARAGQASLGPPSSRRPQFTPLTGQRGHQRGASVTSHEVVDEHNGGSPPQQSRRLSGFFGRSPPAPVATLEADQADPVALELARVKKELAAAHEALEETRAELSEAHEARDASETCAAALRAFIAENGVGEHQQVPGTTAGPTVTIPQTTQEEKKGWGFKMWRTTPTTSGASGPLSPTESAPTPALSTKLTGFFGARPTAAADSGAASLASVGERDRRSDVSSVEEPAEPVSPVSDTRSQPPAVMVRPLSSISTLDVQGRPDETGKPSVEDAPDAGLLPVAL